MFDFILEIRTGWGEVSKWLIRNCDDKFEAKRKLKNHFNNHMHVELEIMRLDHEGCYVFETHQIKDAEEVIELSTISPDD